MLRFILCLILSFAGLNAFAKDPQCPIGAQFDPKDYGAHCGGAGTCWSFGGGFLGSKNAVKLGWPAWQYSCARSMMPDLSFCADRETKSTGEFCAVAPSQVDSRSRDLYSTKTLQDQRFGFGYHVVGIPKSGKSRGLWVHIVGAYGQPYGPTVKDFALGSWIPEIVEQGYLVVMIAHHNRFSVNGDLCGMKDAGSLQNNCAGNVREEVLTGANTSSLIDGNKYDSIEYRLPALLNYLRDEKHVPLPEGFDGTAIDWSKIHVSGHSSGSNNTYYIAKNRGVRSACFLAGPYDSADRVKQGPIAIADWYTTGSVRTPVSHMGGFISTQDDIYDAVRGAYDLIGLRYGQEYFLTAKREYYDENGELITPRNVDQAGGSPAHAGVVADPSLKSLRASACFRPEML